MFTIYSTLFFFVSNPPHSLIKFAYHLSSCRSVAGTCYMYRIPILKHRTSGST